MRETKPIAVSAPLGYVTQHRTVARLRKLWHSAAFWLVLAFLVPAASSYSVLTHEAIIDSTWDSAIRPLLLQRFPAATADELTQAHAFAYGGCIIQDLGYYPFGKQTLQRFDTLCPKRCFCS